MEEDIKVLEEFKEELKIQYMDLIVCDEEKLIQAIENLIKRNKELEDIFNYEKDKRIEVENKNKELEEYKKYAELTKISCCTAQNCEALNNAIREGIENQKLREHIEEQQKQLNIANKKILSQKGQLKVVNTSYIPKSKVIKKIEEWERALNRIKEAVDVYSVGERVVAKKEDKEECEKLLKFWKEDELIKEARIEAYKELLQEGDE